MRLHKTKCSSRSGYIFLVIFFFKFKKDSEFLTKLSSSREISVVVSSEAITYQKKKSDIQLGRKKFTSTCNVTQLGRFAMCN